MLAYKLKPSEIIEEVEKLALAEGKLFDPDHVDLATRKRSERRFASLKLAALAEIKRFCAAVFLMMSELHFFEDIAVCTSFVFRQLLSTSCRLLSIISSL